MAADDFVKFLVRRDDFSETRFESETRVPLEPNQVRFSVDRFALTSNNISYAAAGDMLDYWSFFPAKDGWGRIPAMGFGDVVETRHPDVPVGERVFGFFPMASELVIDVEGMTPEHYVDGAPPSPQPRPGLPTVPSGRRGPSLRGLSRSPDPLDARAVHDFLPGGRIPRGPRRLRRRDLRPGKCLEQDVDRPGLSCSLAGVPDGSSESPGTPTANLSQNSGSTTPPWAMARPRIFLRANPRYLSTFSGNGTFVTDLHNHLGDALKHHCFVGATHWDAGARDENLPGPEPSFFFAPGEIKNRLDAWGAEEFQRRIREGWGRFCASSDSWLDVRTHQGPGALAEVYANVLGGKSNPREGHVLSLTGADS